MCKNRLESFPVSRFFGFLATNQNTIVLHFEEALNNSVLSCDNMQVWLYRINFNHRQISGINYLWAFRGLSSLYAHANPVMWHIILHTIGTHESFLECQLTCITSMPMTRNKPTAASLRHEFPGCIGQKAHRTTMVHSAEWLRTKEDRVLSPEWSVCGFFLYLFLFVLHFCLNISSLEATLVIKGWCFRSKCRSVGRFCHYSRPKCGMTFCSAGNITHIHFLLSKLSTFTTRTLTLVLAWPFDSWVWCREQRACFAALGIGLGVRIQE